MGSIIVQHAKTMCLVDFADVSVRLTCAQLSRDLRRGLLGETSARCSEGTWKNMEGQREIAGFQRVQRALVVCGFAVDVTGNVSMLKNVVTMARTQTSEPPSSFGC